MFRLIEPINLAIQNEFKLNIHPITSNDHILVVKEFMGRLYDNNLDLDYRAKRILKFIKKNDQHDHTYLNILFHIIPYDIFQRLYQKYNFMTNYWDKQLIDFIYKKNSEYLIVNILNNVNIWTMLVPLGNQFSMEYNFTEHVFNKRYNYLKTILDVICLDNFYLGTDTILLLASNKYFRKLNNINVTLTLFTKVVHVKLNRENKDINVFIGSNNIVINYLNFQIIIYQILYENDRQRLFTMNKYDQQILISSDTNKIYCTSVLYQQLSDPDFINQICSVNKNINVNTMKKWVHDRIRISNKNKIKLKLDTNNNISVCYNCKKYFHNDICLDQYIDMCLDCAEFNYIHKIKMVDLTDKTAFVTGIRYKIGFKIALKLLRCGCKVIGTTRFPQSAWYNYCLQADFAKWKHNLIIYKVNFLDINAVVQLINFVRPYNIDFLINNACQTIRSSKKYIKDITNLEMLLIDKNEQKLLDSDENKLIISGNNKLAIYNKKAGSIADPNWNINKLTLISKDLIFNQFNDIKTPKYESSWNKEMSQIDPDEILEVSMINQIVPTLFVNQLKDTMSKPNFIINVTALEGQFDHKKISTHPHTNMCKSAMNMMVRTLAEEKDKDQYVYAIDPGYVSGVNPQHTHYPLSDEDGASRILDPIIQYFSGTQLSREWIKLRNYVNCPF